MRDVSANTGLSVRGVRSVSDIDAEVRVPGSKSYSHRAAVAAALSDKMCRIYNYLDSEDTGYTLNALDQLGAEIDKSEESLVINGCAGRLVPGPMEIYLGNSGTSMRLLTAVSALGKGPYRFSGTERMHQRPIGELLSALRQIGVSAASIRQNDCPPLEVQGGRMSGTRVSIDCSRSSQYLSGLLLMAPCTAEGLDIHVTAGPVSRPYVEMTIDIMTAFGIEYQRNGFTEFWVPGRQTYSADTCTVEADCSQAGYFWAAAAITGGRVKVSGIRPDTRQGDVRFVRILEEMGCRAEYASDGIAVTGGRLFAVDADMGDMPDLVPTLAVVAAFAGGTTVIRNAAHLRDKESDRLAAVARELAKMGIHVEVTEDGLRVAGGRPRGVEIATYDDHRMAMSFAVAGLAVPGVRIADPSCVEKSFPGFWTVFEELYPK